MSMLTLSGLLLFSDNPKELADFYNTILQRKPDWSGGDFVGWQLGTGNLTIGPHDKVHGKSKNPERMMFNFEIDDVQGEFERIKSLGAKVIAEPYQPGEEPGMWIATFADPDNNFFQLMSPIKLAN